MSFRISGVSYQTRIYLYGALIASGLAATDALVDADLTTKRGWLHVLVIGAGAFGAYVRRHPLPDPLRDTNAPEAAEKLVVAVAAKQAGTTPNLIPDDVREQARQIVNPQSGGRP